MGFARHRTCQLSITAAVASAYLSARTSIFNCILRVFELDVKATPCYANLASPLTALNSTELPLKRRKANGLLRELMPRLIKGLHSSGVAAQHLPTDLLRWSTSSALRGHRLGGRCDVAGTDWQGFFLRLRLKHSELRQPACASDGQTQVCAVVGTWLRCGHQQLNKNHLGQS